MSADLPLYGYNLRFELPGYPELTDAIKSVDINYARNEIHMSITEDRGGKILRQLLDMRDNHFKRLHGVPRYSLDLDATVVEDGEVLRTMRFTEIGVDQLYADYPRLTQYPFGADDTVQLKVTIPYVDLLFR